MAPLRIAAPTATRHGWPLLVIEDAGHVPHIEQTDAFVETLRSIRRC
jgi:pimeloyl-ACP methyl ester carboxylesterase